MTNPVAEAVVDGAKHWILTTIRVVITLLVIAGLGWAVYAGIIRPTTKPNPSTRQEGQRDNYSYTLSPHQTFFGCMNFKIPKPEEIKK
jgi:hypothetical protein